MPRTTLDIDEGVLRELKLRREAEQRSIGEIASELLARALRETRPQTPPLQWRSRSMGVRVDLEDRDAVWAALEGGSDDDRDGDRGSIDR
jgi:hypothetical protein